MKKIMMLFAMVLMVSTVFATGDINVTLIYPTGDERISTDFNIDFNVQSNLTGPDQDFNLSMYILDSEGTEVNSTLDNNLLDYDNQGDYWCEDSNFLDATNCKGQVDISALYDAGIRQGYYKVRVDVSNDANAAIGTDTSDDDFAIYYSEDGFGLFEIFIGTSAVDNDDLIVYGVLFSILLLCLGTAWAYMGKVK